MKVLALFGPTGVGKTGVAIALAELLRERGEDPVAVNCDSIQVYRGLEVLSGAATEAQQKQLEHRLLSFVDVSEEFSAGRYAKLAHAEIDALMAEGRFPIVVGGTGLYLRAALANLDMRPPVPAEIRAEVEADLAERGPEALYAELPDDLLFGVASRDRKRIARITELQRAGIEPATDSERLWEAEFRHPTLLVGLTADRDLLAERIDARVDQMAADGAAEEAKAAEGAARTARSAIGFDQFLADDLDAVKRAHRRYARRQLTWMAKMPGVELVDRGSLEHPEAALQILDLISLSPKA